MSTRCEHCPLRKLEAFIPLTVEEVRFMQRFKVGELVIEPGTTILMEGSNSPQLFTALHGLGLRYKLLESGERQVVNFVLPGDFIGLQAGVMGEISHSVEATTRMTLCVFDRGELWSLFKSQPERAFDLTWIAASEEQALGETLTTVGQRTALAAVAWALLRLSQRGGKLGLIRNGAMPLPYRQQDLADALGLSLVHTNKTLAKLRDRQLALWSEGRLVIYDEGGLARIAGVDVAPERARPLI